MSLWLDSRIPFASSLGGFLRRKEIPRHRYSFFYAIGGLALFLFGVQIVTGMLLSIYYTPTPDLAHESIVHLVRDVKHGWLIRSVHSWSANFLVAVVLLHMFSAYFMKAYRKPRELVWQSGVIILFLVLGFAFTGYLLPWDVTAYFATLIGTEIPKSIPLVGDISILLLRGASDVGSETLQRMFSLHTIILPLISCIVIVFHVILQQFHGLSVPVGVINQERGIPFLPNYLLRDFLTWTIVLGIILGIAIMLPVGIGEKADPYASAPVGIKPEWYFLPLYQALRMIPTHIFYMNGEMLVNVLVVLGTVFWLTVPLIDREMSKRRSKFFTTIGVILAVYFMAAILLAYLT